MWFSGLAAVTSLSRATYAFARDRGLPGSRHLSAVGARFRTPHHAVLFASLVPLAVGFAGGLLSDDQFLAVASLATTALYVSYALPVALGVIARRRGDWTAMGPFSLGRLGPAVGCGAVAWSLFVLATAGLPHGGAYVALLAALGVSLELVYILFFRGRFAGPPLGTSLRRATES
jgi:amino acid transporter